MNNTIIKSLCLAAGISAISIPAYAQQLRHMLMIEPGSATYIPILDPVTGEPVLNRRGFPTYDTIYSGSTFDMNPNTVTFLSPGSAGGIILGTHQNFVLNPDEPHPTGPFGAGTGYGATPTTEGTVLAPFSFFGVSTYVGTNPLSYQQGTIHPAVTAEVDMTSCVDNVCNMTAITESWEVEWNGSAFEQGPRLSAAAGFIPATGTYNRATHEYKLDWIARIVGGPFNGVPGHWVIAGKHGVIAPASDDGTLRPSMVGSVKTSSAALTTAGMTMDTDTEMSCIPDCLDIIAPTNAGVAVVVVPLSFGLATDTLYRINLGGAWQTFNTSGANSIKTAAGSDGLCPPPGSMNYTAKITEGDNCVQVTIADSGPNDGDSLGSTVTSMLSFSQGSGDDAAGAAAETGSLNLWVLFGLLSGLGLIRIRKS